ncbi:MAG TPA: HAMP domain-containing sensor histidine kinase [Pilimelia sp.]|nr:HAMP domain-containing sensor histidine kinase [Pilimelia sp.]
MLAAGAVTLPALLLDDRANRAAAVAEARAAAAAVAGELAAGGADAVAGALHRSGDAVRLHGLADGAAPRVPPTELSRAVVTGRPRTVEAAGGLVYLLPVRVGGRPAVVEAYLPAQRYAPAPWRGHLLGAVALVVVAGHVALGDLVARRVSAPARALYTAARAVGDGDLGARVPPAGPRELADAAAAFNRMADRLAQSRTHERELVADLSHRLRTPLTVLRLDADALVGDPGPEEGALDTGELFLGTEEEADRRRTLRRIRQAVATLETEIDELIRTTRQVVADEPATPQACDAGEVVAARMRFWSAVAADQSRPCTVTGTQLPAPVRVAASELAAALDAVLGNVFRYTSQGTPFEVAVTRRDGYVAVRVDDGGAGIADPDRALRRGASDTGSTGLGLDIARRVTLAADGSVSIDRARLGGASVVMLFRDAEAPPPVANRFGLVGRLAGEPGGPLWPRQRRGHHGADAAPPVRKGRDLP